MILVVGAGPMAQEYAKVLIAQEKSFIVVGRGQESAEKFEQATGVPPYVGGLQAFCNDNDLTRFTAAIITTGVEQLAQTTSKLISHGIKRVLVEKPAGLNIEEIDALAEFAVESQASVFVAYNRRFYASVQAAQKIIERDGGVQSFNFEVTEWGHVIKGITKAEGVKENWFMANTTHVTDLAFFLGGFPQEISSFYTSSSEWHSRSYIFSGAGVSQNGALFSYNGNWGAPGRWNVELLTAKHRLIFCPIEQLHVQTLGSVTQELMEVDDKLDLNFKPGLYKQVEAFILNEECRLCSLQEHSKHAKVYSKIAGY